MLEITGEAKGEILEVTTEETATRDDLQRFEKALKAKKLQEQPVNILFIFKNIDGNTPKAMLEGWKIATHLKSIKKSAIVADETFVGLNKNIENLIPGVEINQYPMEEMEVAKEWLREDYS
ncbi:STAS/SEC14 domain-containing protein [Virgibacillus ihumii]|uniref:STAS/SEC14 domain-containing protein n=1 Tax=Virgibacillus ihumii TaxID=2686091 RepID=UPI00157C4D66|nr:STAS/SEC14 domain-containing protein [Virgibacillus ihumii]